MPAFLADYPPHRVAEITGIPEADIRTAARMIADAGEWMSCWTMGLNQSTHGTWNTNAICNLHLATGAICRPGSGPMSLTGQPNAMGGREMGYMGPGLPGQRSVASAADREFVEKQWGLPAGTIRADIGPGTIAMFDRLAAATSRRAGSSARIPLPPWRIGRRSSPGWRPPSSSSPRTPTESTATNRYADIVLPATLWAESDAVMVNSERNLTLLQASIPPAGQARPDWQLICQVAAQLGFGEHFDFASSEQVFDEIRRFSNPQTGYDLRGVSYSRLRQTPLQWPCPPDDDDDRHPIRYLNDGVSQDLFVDADGRRPRLAFPTPSRRAVFHARPHMESARAARRRFPVGAQHRPAAAPVAHHDQDRQGGQAQQARQRAVRRAPSVRCDGNGHRRTAKPVELTSRRGRAVLPAVVTERVRPGSCFVPFHWNDEHGEYLTVNALTNDAVDADSLQPEFKACAVNARPVGPVLHRKCLSEPNRLMPEKHQSSQFRGTFLIPTLRKHQVSPWIEAKSPDSASRRGDLGGGPMMQLCVSGLGALGRPIPRQRQA